MVTRHRSPLSRRFVREVTRPGRYGDGYGGHGLSLLVKPTASGRLSKTWSQRLRLGGREIMVGLGSYPVVTLDEARSKALDNRRTVEAGRHPRHVGVPTFAEAAERVIALREGLWRTPATAKEWRSSLRRHAFPVFGHKPVTEVTRADIYRVLEGSWTQTALASSRLAERIGAVMTWAMGAGFRDDDPTPAAAAALPKRTARVEHRRALPHGDVARALAAVRASGARPAVVLAFEMVALTACRSGEVRGARWPEFDLEARLWTIPAERYKTGRDHRVPLSQRALEVLDEAAAAHPPGPCPRPSNPPRTASGEAGGPPAGGRLVFPVSTGRVMPVNALGRLASRLDLATVHGLRTSFREWAAETGVPDPVAEAALGHVVGGVAGSYQRSDLLDLRRDLMEAWAQYIAP